MAKKQAKKTTKAKKAKAKKTTQKPTRARSAGREQRGNQELMLHVTSQSLSSIALESRVRMPLHACLDNGPGAKCTLMQYNPDSGQYDIDVGDIDCSLCTHFIQPTQ
jgi:hypothetical protein